MSENVVYSRHTAYTIYNVTLTCQCKGFFQSSANSRELFVASEVEADPLHVLFLVFPKCRPYAKQICHSTCHRRKESHKTVSFSVGISMWLISVHAAMR